MKRTTIIGFIIISLFVLQSCSKDGSSSSNGDINFTPSPAKGVRYQTIRLRLSEDIFSATWSSSNPDIANYIRNTSSSGDFSCNMEGSATIRAVGEDKSAETQLEVIPSGTWEGVPLIFPDILNTISDALFLDEQYGWLCGGREGFAYITENGGQTWQNRFPASFNIGWVYKLFFLNKSTGWAAALSGELFKTENAGLTWTQLPELSGVFTQDLIFLDSNTGFLISGAGLFKTTDGGSSWTRSLEGGFSTIYFVDAQYGWTIESRKNYRTIDGGDTWIEGPRIHPSPGSASQLHFENSMTGWFIKSGKVYVTEDGGESYEELSLDGFSPSVLGIEGMLKTDNNYGWAFSGTRFYQTANGFEHAADQLASTTGIYRGMGYAGDRIFIFTTTKILFNDRY